MADLKPCPFCGITLAANNNRRDLYVRRYGTHYQHPVNDCYLSDTEVSPSQIEDWNRRAAHGVASASKAAAETGNGGGNGC